MKRKGTLGWDQLRIFVCVTIAGAILHGLFDLWPSILTEFVAPVNESIWEHVKIVFWPLLVGLIVLYGGKKLASSLTVLLACSGAMLVFGWLYHIVLKNPAGFTDIAVYVLLMAVGCVLPAFWEVSESWIPMVVGGTVLVVVLLVTFTIMPPDFMLFHDASLVDAWVRYPC